MEYLITILDKDTLPKYFSLPKINFNYKLKAYNTTENEAEIVNKLQNTDIAIINKANLTAKVLNQLLKLKLIIITATGFNNVDLDYCKKNKISVCNMRGYAKNTVAEHTFSLLLNLTRKIYQINQQNIGKQWKEATSFCLLENPIIDLQNKKLGILGSGAIGQQIYNIALAFEMLPFFWLRDKTKNNERYLELNDLLKTSDVIIVACPLSKQTKNLINQKNIVLLKKQAILINVSRGGIINEQAWAEAIKSGNILAGATDVLSQEPPKNNNPLLELKNKYNFIITPHIAWTGKNAIQQIETQIKQIFNEFEQGNKFNNLTK